MVQRRAKGLAARITFSRDFHELLTGDLCRGQPLHIAYDPRRIVPADTAARCGEPDRPVTLHARFFVGGSEMTLPLVSPAGIVDAPAKDASRRACLVEGTLLVPADADGVSLWFSYPAADGERQDDDYGATFRFRFPCHDLLLNRAEVVPLPTGGGAVFAVDVAAAPDIERMQVRYRLLGEGSPQVGESELSADAVIADVASGRRRWTSPLVLVPAAAIVRFKLFYWIGGVRFKDDDGGNYFLAPDPGDAMLPAPPPELLASAATWVW